MAEAENMDRELENLLGQFLEASFQSDKLAEMVYERVGFGNAPKEAKLLLQSANSSRPPMLVTIRIEPPPSFPIRREERTEGLKAFCVVETPSLDVKPERLKYEIEEMMTGSLSWWNSQETQYSHLKLGEWKTSVSVINSEDSRSAQRVYGILGTLEEKRTGEGIRP